MKVYKALFKRYREEPNNEVFASFLFDSRNGGNWETPFETIATGTICKHEDWNFATEKFRNEYSNQKYPILTNYLNYTFIRAQELNLISYSTDGDKACFNTGLQTPEEKDVFATFYKNKKSKEYDSPDWTFYTFAESYSAKLKPFEPCPDIPIYINDPSDLVFDFNLGDIDVNYNHIIDKNRDRLPEALKDNDRLALVALKGSIESLKDRIRRNYKIAIPHWYEQKIQLLLPLNLMSDNNADLAMVVDKDKDRKKYFARTVLSMDMAYIDARLITRPDRDWLNP
jgi:hypothetical protein